MPYFRPYFMGMFPYIGLKNRPALYMVGTSNLGSQIIFPERWLENQPNVCVFLCVCPRCWGVQVQNSLLILETARFTLIHIDSHRFTMFIYFPGFCLTTKLEGHNASRFPSETTTMVTLRTPEGAEAWPRGAPRCLTGKKPWKKTHGTNHQHLVNHCESSFFLTWPKFFGCPSGNVFIFLVVKHRFLGGSPCWAKMTSASFRTRTSQMYW